MRGGGVRETTNENEIVAPDDETQKTFPYSATQQRDASPRRASRLFRPARNLLQRWGGRASVSRGEKESSDADSRKPSAAFNNKEGELILAHADTSLTLSIKGPGDYCLTEKNYLNVSTHPRLSTFYDSTKTRLHKPGAATARRGQAGKSTLLCRFVLWY